MRLFILLLFMCQIVSAETYKLKADVGCFIELPGAYKLTPDALPELFEQGDFRGNPYFAWLDAERTRAIFKKQMAGNVFVDLTILDGKVPVDEVVVDFENGKFLGCTISVHNRGDSGMISFEDFERRQKLIGQFITKALDTKARKRVANPKKGVMTSGFKWQSERGMAVLEYNPESPNRCEFMRLRLARKAKSGIYAAALQDRSMATVRKSELKRNVSKQGDEVWVTGLPMVDQGLKGYCVVASVQRLFEYFGISCDMHQLAQIAQSDPKLGTNSLEVNRQLGKIDYLFKTRYKCLAVGGSSGLTELKDGKYVGDRISSKDFIKQITKSVDTGVPLLWCLNVGHVPEEPPLLAQMSGGHMRMIIGYDLAARRLIFSDSWGAGHAKKSMSLDDAYKVTTGLFSMVPTTN